MNYELFSNYRSWYMKSKYETWASNEDKYKSIKSPTTVNGSKRHVIILIVAIFCYKFSKWLLRRHWAHWKKKTSIYPHTFLACCGLSQDKMLAKSKSEGKFDVEFSDSWPQNHHKVGKQHWESLSLSISDLLRVILRISMSPS